MRISFPTFFPVEHTLLLIKQIAMYCKGMLRFEFHFAITVAFKKIVYWSSTYSGILALYFLGIVTTGLVNACMVFSLLYVMENSNMSKTVFKIFLLNYADLLIFLSLSYSNYFSKIYDNQNFFYFNNEALYVYFVTFQYSKFLFCNFVFFQM